jgi:hypothetical protein
MIDPPSMTKCDAIYVEFPDNIQLIRIKDEQVSSQFTQHRDSKPLSGLSSFGMCRKLKSSDHITSSIYSAKSKSHL